MKNANIISLRLKQKNTKNRFLEIAEKLHQTPSSLAAEIINNYVKDFDKKEKEFGSLNLEEYFQNRF